MAEDRRQQFAAKYSALCCLVILAAALGLRGEVPANADRRSVEPQRPRVFRLPPEAVANARARIASGTTSLDAPEVVALVKWAERALAEGPFSVLDKTTVPPSGDRHDYWSLAAYWWPDPSTEDGLPYIRKDGQHNPEWKTDIADSYRLKKMAWTVERLAIASFLLDQEKYARHAAHLLRVWFLEPETRMNPHLKYAQAVPGRDEDGRSLGIIDSLYLTRVVDAIGLLAFSQAWTADDQRGMEAWFAAYLDWLLTSEAGVEERGRKNNHGTYIDVQLVSYSLFLGRTAKAREILEAAKATRIEQAIEPDGGQPHELRRTRSFKYCVYNLRGLFDLASMGEVAGVDLWRFQTDDGRSLRKALDFVAPYVDPQKFWPHQEISSRVETREYLTRLLRRAAIVYQHGAYEELVRKYATPESLTPLHHLFYPAPH